MYMYQLFKDKHKEPQNYKTASALDNKIALP